MSWFRRPTAPTGTTPPTGWLPAPENLPERVVYVDRLISGQDYVLKLWRTAVARSEWRSDYAGLSDYAYRHVWGDIAREIYTLMARPWFEEEKH